jgi:protocatechuate 3,4-dioxygenase, alpha subunit
VTLPRTPSQTVGPFYSIGLCRRTDNELVARDDEAAVHVSGMLLDGAGEPIPDGLVELWSAPARAWGRCGTHPDGRFDFVLAKPPAAPGGAPRYDVYVFARGLLRHQLTRLYFPDEPEANAVDPVLAALAADERATLVARAEGDGLRFDIRMQGESQTVFFAT